MPKKSTVCADYERICNALDESTQRILPRDILELSVCLALTKEWDTDATNGDFEETLDWKNGSSSLRCTKMIKLHDTCVYVCHGSEAFESGRYYFMHMQIKTPNGVKRCKCARFGFDVEVRFAITSDVFISVVTAKILRASVENGRNSTLCNRPKIKCCYP